MKRMIVAAKVDLQSMSDGERYELANTTDDPQILANLASDESYYVRDNVAKRISDPKILMQLVDDNAGMVQSSAINRIIDIGDPELTDELVNYKNWIARSYLAKRVSDPDILAKLVDDPETTVRRTVAERTNDPEVLAKLVNDEDWGVRQAVAERTDDPAILELFADDIDEAVRGVVAKRTNNVALLSKLADDESDYVRKFVARRTKDPSILAKIAERDRKPDWPSRSWWLNLDPLGEDFEDAWQKYLASSEDQVNEELQIFPEPSIQGGYGSLFVFDESGEGRDSAEVDWQEYLDWQLNASATSKNANEYKQKYRKYMKELCGI